MTLLISLFYPSSHPHLLPLDQRNSVSSQAGRASPGLVPVSGERCPCPARAVQRLRKGRFTFNHNPWTGGPCCWSFLSEWALTASTPSTFRPSKYDTSLMFSLKVCGIICGPSCITCTCFITSFTRSVSRCLSHVVFWEESPTWPIILLDLLVSFLNLIALALSFE